MDAILENPGSDVIIRGKNEEPVLEVMAKQQGILIKYIKMALKGDEKPKESDMRKFKPATFLLHMNDIIFLKRDFFRDVLLHYDLTLDEYGYTPLKFDCPRNNLLTDMRQCGQCNKIGKTRELLKCGHCKIVYYCNEDCQRKHWRAHKQICQTLFKEMTNQSFIEHKQCLAWKMVLMGGKSGRDSKSIVHEYFDKVEAKYGKKSKVLLLTQVYGKTDNDRTCFELRTVSMRFFTNYSDKIVRNHEMKQRLISASQIMKRNSDLFMLAIPYDGDFNFHFIC